MSSLPQAQLDEVHRVFRAFLKERGQRQTPERFAILDEVYTTPAHFDADELFVRMKQRGARVSRATVYNTLELLLECDLVVKHQFGRSQAKYERAFAYWQHDHLICLDCGHILEFCDPRLQSIQDTVGEIYGFEIRQHALHLYGHCHREGCPNRNEPALLGNSD
jgi:Fur family transcriptional regulator, ferric uptake regulator